MSLFSIIRKRRLDEDKNVPATTGCGVKLKVATDLNAVRVHSSTKQHVQFFKYEIGLDFWDVVHHLRIPSASDWSEYVTSLSPNEKLNASLGL